MRFNKFEITNEEGGPYICFNHRNEPDLLVNFNTYKTDDFYENFYSEESFGERALEKTRQYQSKEVLKQVKNHLKENTEGLDIGCGNGQFVNFINSGDYGIDAYGVDPALNHESLNLKKASIYDLNEVKGLPAQFGVIFLMDVLEHFEKPDDILAILEDICLPGAPICISGLGTKCGYIPTEIIA